jgi:hypothetical protein
MISHSIYFNILSSRDLRSPQIPMWKMNISVQEYSDLQQCLQYAYKDGSLEYFGREAALYYAEWWRTEYNGGIPSKEDVAVSIGLPNEVADDLFNYARKALSDWGVPFIHDKKFHYFRTLLLQGGLPIYHIKSNQNDFSSYKMFLNGLVRELSQFNTDWNDISIVQKLNCISYLPKSFNTNSIYDLSLQIAHAIIDNREDLLPYDRNLGELKELTKSLKEEHERSQREKVRKPFIFQWELQLNGTNKLHYYLDSIRTVYSSNIKTSNSGRLNSEECYQFDLFVSQKYVATYKRTHIDADGIGEYRRMNSDNQIFEWKGEPFIDVKLICDNGDNLFITVAGCYPPDFCYPQVFQKNGNTFVQRKRNNSEENIIIYSNEWVSDVSEIKTVSLHNLELYISPFATSISLQNTNTGENLQFTNNYFPYTIEFNGTYIDWIENSNYKLLDKPPFIVVYDQNNQLVHNANSFYRLKNESEWKKIQRYTSLPVGLLEIKIVLPDGQNLIETFYSIQNLSFYSSQEKEWNAKLKCNCNWGLVQSIIQDGLTFETIGENEWSIVRDKRESLYPTTCSFIILKDNCPALHLSIPSPFRGMILIDDKGMKLQQGEIISLSNLLNYKIVEHGMTHSQISFNYLDKNNCVDSIKITMSVKNGITPLSNYEETIERLFNLYGDNSFDRVSAVMLDLNGQSYRIRKFVLDSIKTRGDRIIIRSNNTEVWEQAYEGKILGCPMADDLDITQLIPVELELIEENSFKLPQNTQSSCFIVFSDVFDHKRIIPKYYEVKQDENQEVEKTTTSVSVTADNQAEIERKWDLSIDERKTKQSENIVDWIKSLTDENICTGMHWKKAIVSLEIASLYRLPFRTFNSISAAVASPYLFCKLLLALFVVGKKDLLISEILRLEQEYAIAVHWIRPDDWNKVQEDLNIYPEKIMDDLVKTYPEFINELLELTLDPQSAQTIFRFISGILSNVDKNFLSAPEVNEFRSRAVGKIDNNQDLPVYKIVLNASYYRPPEGMRPYQYTLINAPLRVYEYLQNKDESLWRRDYDYQQIRRIINFYRRYFVRTYCEILTRMLN